MVSWLLYRKEANSPNKIKQVLLLKKKNKHVFSLKKKFKQTWDHGVKGEDGYRITEKSVGKEKWSKRSFNQIWWLAEK